MDLTNLRNIWARVRGSAGVFGHNVFLELEQEIAKVAGDVLARLETVEKQAGITPPAPSASESVTDRASADASAAATAALSVLNDPAEIRKLFLGFVNQLFPDGGAAKPGA